MGLHMIPVTKAGKRLIEVDSGEAGMSEATYNSIFEIGLKHVVNLGVSNLKQADFASLAEFENAAYEIAMKQVAKIKAGKVTGVSRTAKAPKSSVEMVEALRLAKIYAKSELKAAGIKVSAVKAADITIAAKAYIDADPETWLNAAKASLAAATAPKTALNIADMVKEDPVLVAKAEKAKKEAKAARAAKAPAKAKPVTKAKAKPGVAKHA
jgi:hypothetical protein